jgi:hypothetical protein
MLSEFIVPLVHAVRSSGTFPPGPPSLTLSCEEAPRRIGRSPIAPTR